MKKLLIATALFVSSASLNAQDAVSSLFAPKRIVKTNLAGYALLSVSANYEQKTGGKTSVGLLAGYKLPSVIKVEAIGTFDGDQQTYTGDVEPQGLFINPYFRFYPKETFKGFYVEAFLRYFNYNFLLPYDYLTNEGRNIRGAMDGNASAFGGGIGLGAQFTLAPRLYMDIGVGAGMASGNVHVETNDPDLTLADYITIKENIEKYQDDADVQVFLLGDILTDPKAGASSTQAWADFENKVFPIMRGGISIGYAF
jgi:hypothetical protein